MLQALRADNSPFTEQQIELLQAGFNSLNAAQSAWLSGYIAGRLAGDVTGLPLEQGRATEAAPAAQPVETFHVYYASQTGNGEALALSLAERGREAGLAVAVGSLATLRPAALKKVKYAAFVISTHGEGDPPDDAVDLIEYLASPRAPRLDSLQYSILALGDRSYSQFCAAGRRLDSLLQALGASAFSERIECDVDYASPAEGWSLRMLDFGRDQLAPAVSARAAALPVPSRLSVVPRTARWTRNSPYEATVERIQKITGLTSQKDVYHVELSLQDAGLEYEPGDSLGVWAHNSHALVDQVLGALGIDGGEDVALDGVRHTMHEWLSRHRELTRLSPDTITAYAAAAANATLAQRFEALDEAGRRDFIESRQFIDLLEEYPPAEKGRISASTLAKLLRPLAPRSYSIASSRASVDEEVHLTVATLFSDAIGKQRRGVASDYLNHQLQPGDSVGVYLEPNKRFRLPEDRRTPLILVAAGTGIAPYRAFLQQLEEEGESPDTWLIFGNPHLRTDFLYQREWLEWRRTGLVNRIDCAFSRDQAEKRYVQHIVREQGERIDDWLRRDARVYLCGSLAMGHEVEQALEYVLASQRDLDAEAAREQLAELRRGGRLLKDLY